MSKRKLITTIVMHSKTGLNILINKLQKVFKNYLHIMQKPILFTSRLLDSSQYLCAVQKKHHFNSSKDEMSSQIVRVEEEEYMIYV